MNLSAAASIIPRLKIRNKQKEVVPFILNDSQLLVIDKMKGLQAQGKPVWAIVLKARQVGVSTLTEALLVLHCMSQPNARAMIIAHQYKSSKSLFEIAKLMRASVPVKMPKGTQHMMEIPHKKGNSRVEVATAGSTSGGRGLTLSACHFSEAAYFPGSAGSFTSLLPAIAYNENSFVVIESTANGKQGEGQSFYDLWCAAMEGRNEFVPIFIPWTMDRECSRDAHDFEGPQDEEEEKLLESGVTPEQMAWRRFTIDTRCQGMVENFHQEFPITWEEAFVSSGNPAFNSKELFWARSNVMKPKAIVTFKRSAGHIVFEPDKKGVRLWETPQCSSEGGRSSHPNRNCPKCNKYYIGADVARGSDSEYPDDRYKGDFSALVMWNGTTGRQAARYSEHIGPEQLADIIDMVGRTYNNAMVNVELTGGFGNHTQKVLRDYFHYPNLYRWKGKDDAAPGKNIRPSLGWETTWNSRRLLMSEFREALRDHRATPLDDGLVAQIEAASFSQLGIRWDVEEGHDDIIMAGMVGWIARAQYPPPILAGNTINTYTSSEQEDEEQKDELLFKNDPRWTLMKHWKHVRRGNQKDRLEGI